MEARVAAGLTVFVGVSLAVVLTVTTRAVTNRSLERASDDLDAARTAFARLVANRADFAASQSRLITALPVFRSHMTDVRLASDMASLDAMADDYRRQLNAQFCIVTDHTGRWIGSPGWRSGEEPPAAVLSGISGAVKGQPQRTVTSLQKKLFLVISEPALFADETLGTLTAGYALDDAVADELADLTRAEVNLAAGTDLSGSSLPSQERAGLQDLLRESPSQTASAGSLVVRRIGNIPYVTGTFPLLPDRTSGGAGQLVLLQDWRPTQRFLDDLRTRLLLAGIATFALAIAGGFVFSRRMSRPLKEISTAAGDIAAGNWARQVPVSGSAEATAMAGAFNEMSSHLRHWHEQAEDRAERLQASYDRFHSVTESARDGIVSTNAAGAISFWNRSAATLFGYSESEALGRPVIELFGDADRPTYLDALAAESGEAGLTVGQTIELTGMRKDGSGFPIEVSLSTWRTARAAAVTLVVRDASERKRSAEALRQREAELRQAQKLEAIGLLAGGVAHDFNNLLMAIQGYGDLLLMDLDEGDKRRDDVKEILKASHRAAALTRQLLAFGRRQVLAPQVLSLIEVVAGTESLLRRLIGEDIKIVSVSEPDLGKVLADPGQIEQVLINLAVNARDAMPGGGTLSITLANARVDADEGQKSGIAPGRYVRVDVADTGSGMAPEVASRIFEPFFTTKGEGKGTGLGLATVYGIIQQSGGSIQVDSEPGRGTMFRIYLPQSAREEPAAQRQSPTAAAKEGSETILLVEDDNHVRSIVALMLRQCGYVVLDVDGGDRALDIIRAHGGPIDLLLTDVVMPSMNGRVLAERLLALSPKTRVLFMSGYSDDAILRAGVQAAETAFLQKPFSKPALAAKVREVLEVLPGATSKSTPLSLPFLPMPHS
jgi:PAS domain S-box-containing protein